MKERKLKNAIRVKMLRGIHNISNDTFVMMILTDIVLLTLIVK